MVGHVAATGHMRYAPDVDLDPYYIPCEPDTRSEVTFRSRSAAKSSASSPSITRRLTPSHATSCRYSKPWPDISRSPSKTRACSKSNASNANACKTRQTKPAVQQALLLKAIPLVPGFTFETAWHPAGAVAGDWYDFIDLGDDRYGIALADVSGKGMPAALLMSATRAILRSLAKLDPSPGQTLLHLNQTLSEDFPMGKFVTMIYAVLDARSREITVASAGHLRPLLINGECTFLEVDTGLPLGLGASSYPEYTIKLEPGTKLLFYTDGITEAINRDDEEYGARASARALPPTRCLHRRSCSKKYSGSATD